MRKNFRELEVKMSPEAIRRSDEKTRKMIAEMPLTELREAKQLTQAEIAQVLSVTQPEVSRLEKRVDVYVSTLSRFIEALGGKLMICARFPEGDVRITQFEDIGAIAEAESKKHHREAAMAR